MIYFKYLINVNATAFYAFFFISSTLIAKTATLTLVQQYAVVQNARRINCI